MNQAVQILLKNATTHIQKKEFQQSKELLFKAREIDHLDPSPLRLLAVVAAMEFEFHDALILIDQVIELDPENAIAYSNRGNILKELGKYEEALHALDIAIQLAPAYAEAYCNKGNVLQELHRYEEALAWYDKAFTLNPHYAEAYSNKGNALSLLHRHEQAMTHYIKAIEIDPRFIDSYWHMALVQLSLGDFHAGWQNYEARWFKTHNLQFQFSEIPRLESLESILGKKVLIWSEQGLGDTLQFCRYIEPLFNLGAHITFAVPAQLAQVLGFLKQFCTLVVLGEEKVAEFDFQSPLLSLPLVFKTSLESIPNKIPYIQVDEEKKLLCSKEIQDSCNLKVGVIWNGGFRADHPELWAINKRRNIEFDEIAALKDVPLVDFYSLQKGDPAESDFVMRKAQVWPNIINCAPLLNDFSDTAALMDCLDLIISVDTSSAHLAGALGRPVWILNRYDSCWRWLNDREDSPWYPTAKIYQQTTPGDWNEVIARVKADLAILTQKKQAEI